MGAKSHVSKWGSSLAVRIPRPIAEQWGVQEGSPIEILPDDNQIVMRKTPYDLTDILDWINPDHLHGESLSGPAQGNEEW